MLGWGQLGTRDTEKDGEKDPTQRPQGMWQPGKALKAAAQCVNPKEKGSDKPCKLCQASRALICNLLLLLLLLSDFTLL